MNFAQRLILALILTLTLASCNTPEATPTALSATSAVGATPTAAASPSPTSPLVSPEDTPQADSPPVTPTPSLALPTPPPILDGTPVVSSPGAQPPALDTLSQPEDTINILLVGSDEQDEDGTLRTDAVLVVCIFPEAGVVRVISVPRDFYAWIPTWGLDRINTAYQHGETLDYPGGGPGLLKATVEYNLGLPIHYYAQVDFQGYEALVDAVGGVTLTLAEPFDEWVPDPDAPDGKIEIHLEAGEQHLDGATALLYVRARQQTSDLDRNRRQLQVLRAVYAQAMSRDLYKYVPELWETFQEYVETDLKLAAMLSLAKMAPDFDLDAVGMRQITVPDHLTPWTTPTGGAVLVPQYEALAAFLKEAARPPAATRAAQPGYRVEIVDASGVAECGAQVSEALQELGLAVITTTVAAEPVPATVIEDYTTTSKGSPLSPLIAWLGPVEVVARPQTERAVDFKLILGRDFACPGE